VSERDFYGSMPAVTWKTEHRKNLG